MKYGFGAFLLKLQVVYLTMLVLEVCCQVLAMFHLIPGLNFRTNVPYGRVYWTKEGTGVNSMMNRFGWYSQEAVADAGAYRIVLIGDSMIEGVQVEKGEKIDVRLQWLLNNSTRPGKLKAQVFSLGESGAYPGYYLEYMRYAINNYSPKEIVLFITTWNDFRNALPQDENLLDSYLYYDLSPDGRLVPQRATLKIIERFHNDQDLNIVYPRPLVFETVRSHVMVMQIMRRSLLKLKKRNVQQQKEAHSEGPPVDGEKQFMAGIDGFIFKKHQSPDALKAMEINLQIIRKCQELAWEKGVTLRVVTIPHFPEFFYNEQPASNWTPEFDDVDLFLPERKISDFSHKAGIDLLPGGEMIQKKNLGKEEIRALYIKGVGHWTPKGHAVYADMLFDRFYTQRLDNNSSDK